MDQVRCSVKYRVFNVYVTMFSPVTFRIREEGSNVGMFCYITFASLCEIRFLVAIHALRRSLAISIPLVALVCLWQGRLLFLLCKVGFNLIQYAVRTALRAWLVFHINEREMLYA